MFGPMTETLHTADGRSVLRMERHFRHPPEKVWRAITEPEHLGQWFPAAVTFPRGTPGTGDPITFTFPGEPADTASTGTVTAHDPPRLFAYTWNDELLHWELRADDPGGGCLLVFTHTFDDRPGAASFAAGWHTCIEALRLLLDGRPVEVDDVAVDLHEKFIVKFGLDAGTAETTADGWRVRFDRQFMHAPVDTVWAALGGADARIGLVPPPAFTTPRTGRGPVTGLAGPDRIEYETGGGRVRWELSPGPGGARLVLVHTGPPGPDADDARDTALNAWHDHISDLAKQFR
jgi:uncharacterized protein YndB with AHSA1/START domain